MRSLMIALVVALSAVCGPASAQLGMDAETMQIVSQLQSESAAVRERAARHVERNPGAYPPLVVLALVPALTEQGRHDDALRWRYFSQLRMLTDVHLMMAQNPGFAGGAEDWAEQLVAIMQGQLPELENFTPTQRRRVLEDAIRLDERTPRLYALSYSMGFSVGGDMAWPSREAIGAARTRAATAVRALLEREITRSRVLAAIDAEIAADGVASEAEAFIPAAWRGRVVAQRSVRIDNFCAAPVFAPTPAGAAPEAFIAGCARGDFFPSQRGEPSEIRWYSSDGLEMIAKMRAPQPIWNGFTAARGGASFAMFRTNDVDELATVLLAVDGSVSVVSTPGAELHFNNVSRSGRYAMRMTANGYEVIDLETSASVFTRARRTNANPSTNRYALLAEPGGGQVLAVGYERTSADQSPGGDLVAVDIRTGRERRLTIANAMPFLTPLAWGTSQVVVNLQSEPVTPAATPTVETYTSLEAFEASRRRNVQRSLESLFDSQVVALVDLVSMRVEWSGPRRDLPPPRHGYSCSPADGSGRYSAAMYSRGTEAAQWLNVPGARVQLETPQRGGVSSCAISADGGNLVIVAPPYVHHYTVAAN